MSRFTLSVLGVLTASALLTLTTGSVTAEDAPAPKRAAAPRPPPKNLKEALANLFAYEIKGRGVTDLGRNSAMAFVARTEKKFHIDKAFKELSKLVSALSEQQALLLARKVDLVWLEALDGRRRKAKDVALRRCRLQDLIDRTVSTEEMVRRLKDLKSADEAAYRKYRKAIVDMDLVLIPAGVEFWRGYESVAVAKEDLRAGRKEFGTGRATLFDLGSNLENRWPFLAEGAGFATRSESHLVGAFELGTIPVGPTSTPLFVGRRTGHATDYVDLVEAVERIAPRYGFRVDVDITLIDEDTWEHAMRGSHNRRHNVIGTRDHAPPRFYNGAIVRGGDLTTLIKTRAQHLKTFPLDISPYGLIAGTGNAHEYTLRHDSRMVTTGKAPRSAGLKRMRRLVRVVRKTHGVIGHGVNAKYDGAWRPVAWQASISYRVEHALGYQQCSAAIRNRRAEDRIRRLEDTKAEYLRPAGLVWTSRVLLRWPPSRER